MKRCEFTTLVNGAILKRSGLAIAFLAGLLSITSPTIGYSGEAKKPIHIGVIAFSAPALRTSVDQSLIRGLREQGYVEGVNLTIEWRYADGDRGRVPQAARDLAGMKLDAIVTTCTPSTRAMVAAAPNTPIVMASVSDPIGQGFIGSYRHPGGRITGTASQFEDMLVLPEATTVVHQKLISTLAARNRLPAVYSFKFMVREGALMLERGS